MSTGSQIETPGIRDALLSAIALCDERVRVGKINQERYAALLQQYNTMRERADNMTMCFNHTTKIYKNIQEHERLRREAALNIMNDAIAEVDAMVPDANLKGMKMRPTESGEVRIVNERGQDINKREGGAARSSLGCLLRYAICMSNSDVIKMMLFDEAFFTLSDTTTSEMKKTLQSLSKHCLIILVEQRRNVAEGIVDVEFEFVKDEKGVTHVTRTQLRGENKDD